MNRAQSSRAIERRVPRWSAAGGGRPDDDRVARNRDLSVEVGADVLPNRENVRRSGNRQKIAVTGGLTPSAW